MSITMSATLYLNSLKHFAKNLYIGSWTDDSANWDLLIHKHMDLSLSPSTLKDASLNPAHRKKDELQFLQEWEWYWSSSAIFWALHMYKNTYALYKFIHLCTHVYISHTHIFTSQPYIYMSLHRYTHKIVIYNRNKYLLS